MTSNRIVIGRDASAGIVIAGPRAQLVSALHAEIRFADDGSWVVVDLGSTNGTYVNGVRVAEARRLADSDRISLAVNGPSYTVVLAEPAATILDRALTPAGPTLVMDEGMPATARQHEPVLGRKESAPEHTIVLRRVKGGGELRACAQTIVLGRDADCHIGLRTQQDPTVSGRHAEIRFTPEGLALLADLGSRNGTWLGKQRIDRPVPLRLGDRFALGQRGPAFEVRQIGASGAPSAPGVAPRQRAAQSLTSMIAGAKAAAKQGGTAMFAAAIARGISARASRKLRLTVAASAVAVLAVALFAYRISSGRVAVATREAQAARLKLAAELEDAARARARTDSQIQRLSQELEGARRSAGASGSVDSLAQRLEAVRGARAALVASTEAVRSLDLRGISRMNSGALAGVTRGTAAAVGFFITSDGYLLTAGRFLGAAAESAATDSIAVFPRGGAAAGRLHAEIVSIGFGAAAGLALLRVRDYEGPSLGRVTWLAATARPQLPVVAMGFRALATGDSLSPIRWRPISSPGLIVSIDSARATVLAFATPPLAGSPIFDGSGALIGVNVGTLREGPVRMEMLLTTHIVTLLPPELRAHLGITQ